MSPAAPEAVAAKLRDIAAEASVQVSSLYGLRRRHLARERAGRAGC